MLRYFILTLVAVMSLVSFAPALANENKSEKNAGKKAAEIKKELKKEIKEENKEIKGKLKELQNALRFVPKAMTLTGKLVSINSPTSSTSTEITINVIKALPARPKKFATSTVFYPEKGKDLVLKISDKALLVRAYGAKMKISEMTIGDELGIVAKFNKDGSLDARVIRDNSLHILLNKKGVVESIDANGLSFVLKQDNRTLAVKVTDKTKFHMKGSTSTSFADLKIGDKATVTGIINTNIKTVYANSVIIKRPPAVPAPIPTVSTSTTST
jgi:hypothetical protein